MKTILNVENLKCGGCASTIRNNLKIIPGVTAVSVDPDSGTVEVEYENENTLAEVKNKLRGLGYPEAGTVSGFEKIATNAKSYVSCAVGKFTKEEENEF